MSARATTVMTAGMEEAAELLGNSRRRRRTLCVMRNGEYKACFERKLRPVDHFAQSRSAILRFTLIARASSPHDTGDRYVLHRCLRTLQKVRWCGMPWAEDGDGNLFHKEREPDWVIPLLKTCHESVVDAIHERFREPWTPRQCDSAKWGFMQWEHNAAFDRTERDQADAVKAKA